MIRKLFLTQPWLENWVCIVRICTGIMILKEGCGIFSSDHMKGNIAWLADIHFPFPHVTAYVGKSAEFIGGMLLVVGFLTRLACFALIIDMLVIVFIMGKGQIFSDYQYPFCLLLLFANFLLLGSGKWSVDQLFFSLPKS